MGWTSIMPPSRMRGKGPSLLSVYIGLANSRIRPFPENKITICMALNVGCLGWNVGGIW
jgi:hypothetical protein